MELVFFSETHSGSLLDDALHLQAELTDHTQRRAHDPHNRELYLEECGLRGELLGAIEDLTSEQRAEFTDSINEIQVGEE